MESEKKISTSSRSWINLDEMVYDISMLFGGLFLYNLIVPANKTIIDILNPISAMLLVILLFFFVAIHFGMFLQRIKTHKILFVISICVLFMMHATFSLVPYVFLVGKGLFDKDGAWFPMLLGMFLAPIGFSLAYNKFPIVLSEPSASKSTYVFRLVLFRILLPVIVALMLSLWQEIMVVCSTAKAQGIRGSAKAFTLLWGGIIPIRVLVAISPPYTLLNTTLGVVSSGVYLIALFSRINYFHLRYPF